MLTDTAWGRFVARSLTESRNATQPAARLAARGAGLGPHGAGHGRPAPRRRPGLLRMEHAHQVRAGGVCDGSWSRILLTLTSHTINKNKTQTHSTGTLNRWLLEVQRLRSPPLTSRGRAVKLKYITQVGKRMIEGRGMGEWSPTVLRLLDQCTRPRTRSINHRTPRPHTGEDAAADLCAGEQHARDGRLVRPLPQEPAPGASCLRLSCVCVSTRLLTRTPTHPPNTGGVWAARLRRAAQHQEHRGLQSLRRQGCQRQGPPTGER